MANEDSSHLPAEDPSGNKMDWVPDIEWTDVIDGEPVPHENVERQYRTWTCSNTGSTLREDRDNPDYEGPVEPDETP